MKKLLMSSLVVVAIVFSGCGDEESSAPNTPSLASSYDLHSGVSKTVNMRVEGSDSNGGVWSGSISVRDKGMDYYDGGRI